jgi:imidazolonepropionase-like amidohydrolase
MKAREVFSNIGRRDFLKYAMLTAGVLAMPSVSGCGIRKKNVPYLDYKKPLLLTNARILDVVSGEIIENGWLLIDGGKIVGRGIGAVEKKPGVSVFKMKGRYLIPGLIDAHCHSTAVPVFSLNLLDGLNHIRQMRQNYVSSVESGVTTLRDMGAFSGLLHHFSHKINEGDMPGPRIVYCNSMLNVMGSHPEIPPSDISIFAKPASYIIGMIMNNFRDTEDMEKCLVKNAKGAGFVKLTLDSRTLFCKKEKKIPEYTKEQLDIIFRFADKKGLPVVGHHHFKSGFDKALDYPFHSIEHIVSDVVLSDEEVAAMARRNVAIVPTMTIAQSYLVEEAFDKIPERYRTPEVEAELRVRNDYFKNEAMYHCDPYLHEENLNALKAYKSLGWDNLWAKKKFLMDPDVYFSMVQNGYVNLRKMKEAGVLIGCGIDAGMPFNYFGGNYREYEIFSRVGFSNLDIVRSATLNNAKILKMEDRLGSLDTGKFADIVAYDENPLDDIRVMRNPQLVFKEGELMYSARELSVGEKS